MNRFAAITTLAGVVGLCSSALGSPDPAIQYLDQQKVSALDLGIVRIQTTLTDDVRWMTAGGNYQFSRKLSYAGVSVDYDTDGNSISIFVDGSGSKRSASLKDARKACEDRIRTIKGFLKDKLLLSYFLVSDGRTYDRVQLDNLEKGLESITIIRTDATYPGGETFCRSDYGNDQVEFYQLEQ